MRDQAGQSLSSQQALALHSFFLKSHQEQSRNLMAVKLFSRNKRAAQSTEESMEILLRQLDEKRRKLGLIEEDEETEEKKMREIVTIMIKDEIRKKQQESQVNTNPEFGDRGVIPEINIETLMREENSEEAENPSLETLGGTLALGGRIIPDTGMESLTEAIVKEIKRRTENKTSTESLGESLTTASGLPTPGVIIGVPIEAGTGGSLPPPQVSVEELPSDSPGCRTLATSTCHRTPVIINKKVSISHREGFNKLSTVN